MRRILARWPVIAILMLAWPTMGIAQEAVLQGTVTDTTGAVLPGVTVTAVHEATGNVFEAVTDRSGNFRLPVRVGSYRITVQLAGFQTVTQTGVQLLLGQQLPIRLQMAPAALQETVTVTGDAPLIDTAASSVAANIDPEQMSELPINGRNWMDLALLTPGARRNESGGLVQNGGSFTRSRARRSRST